MACPIGQGQPVQTASVIYFHTGIQIQTFRTFIFQTEIQTSCVIFTYWCDEAYEIWETPRLLSR